MKREGATMDEGGAAPRMKKEGATKDGGGRRHQGWRGGAFRIRRGGGKEGGGCPKDGDEEGAPGQGGRYQK